MSSRNDILKTIAGNKPTLVDLPKIDINAVISYEDLQAQFIQTLEKIGGKAFKASQDTEIKSFVFNHTENSFVINTLTATAEEKLSIQKMSSYDLAAVDVAYIKGTLAVAENGSIWVDENQMVNRVLPFICQHLVIVLHADEIVPTMHHAYEKIDVASSGFGSFIAGPSKTADIEQSLVIGAHGARSLTVILLE